MIGDPGPNQVSSHSRAWRGGGSRAWPKMDGGGHTTRRRKKQGVRGKKSSRQSRRNSSGTPSTSEETGKAHKRGKSSKRHNSATSPSSETPAHQGDTKPYPGPLKKSDKSDEDYTETSTIDQLSNSVNESLRWDGILEDPVAEEERIKLYKLNRQLRYLAAQNNMCKEIQFCQKDLSDTESKRENPYIITSKLYRQLASKDPGNSYFMGHRT